ncbi:hypothetical protein J2Z31_002841 [Sinorhizobium kostiense]|uniref:Uncharacterized protein n=1 Tax=Sinorhizobium kostiense TaxID=76747 RepID=A0ABS4R390_9HYPH|nr:MULTISPECIES: hypothetical protein [Sinorhizobium]MBP2236327.1 hypothetical protein [Sinorhizobium kostiense]
MPEIPLNFTLALSDDDAVALADTLGCTPEDVGENLQLYAPAALREYVEMFAGQAMMSVSDMRERRLLAILLALPAANFPTDERIARLFNLTSLQGRALLRATLSRHRARLKGTMEAAARRFIGACQGEAGAEREARFPNAVVIEMLNAQLSAANAPRSPIRRKPGTFDTYLVANGAFIELQNLYP